ncbi:2-dehydropantoate 2-reductase [Actinoplanes derwentensis]|uniref:2-dehydropantoate 2-reductase n=1 Tax=Actinoplanes derwentensis TaxID=113562 RepID=A0A1H1TUT6_9ACTN|nr:2-dehydropantoate 2-reductase [Actinoplanes derwentensis]GID85126.1 2-dehydropantoate 2-reductase [Actinoplanes derwentensis]SDS63379.1 2-dehydropantoate 2-reductase [Actinoplanes derwentensis]
MSARRTRVAVIGAGSVGTVVAAAAVDAGHDVVVCARRRLQRLVVERADSVREIDVPVLADPSEASEVDWVLLATKAQDAAGAAAWFGPLVGPHTTVVVLQNGVDHAERIEPLVPRGTRVLPALVYVAAESLGPGHVLHRLGARITVPGTPGAAVATARPGFTETAPTTGRASTGVVRGDMKDGFAALFDGSWLHVERVADFPTAAWRKLLTNVGANPVTSLTLKRMSVIQHDPAVRELTRALLGEAIAVGRAAGAALTEADVDHTLEIYDEFGGDDGTSMLYDRLAGRATEHELITGAVVRLGEQHGVPVPLNRAILALMHGVNHK